MSAIEQRSTDLTYEGALALDERIDKWHEQGHKLAIDAYKGRIWLQLGYESWEAYCDTKRHAFAPALDRDARREVVGEMRDAGMSTRAIGSALGVGDATVRRDLDTGAPNDAPAERAPVVGQDGKTYSPRVRVVEPPPPRLDPFAPLVDEEGRAAAEEVARDALRNAKPVTPEERARIEEFKAGIPTADAEKDLARRQRVATDLLDRHVYNLSLIHESTEVENYTPRISSNPITASMLDRAEEAIRHIRKTLTERGVL